MKSPTAADGPRLLCHQQVIVRADTVQNVIRRALASVEAIESLNHWSMVVGFVLEAFDDSAREIEGLGFEVTITFDAGARLDSEQVDRIADQLTVSGRQIGHT